MLLMAALRVRDRTGEGQFIDLAQSGAALLLTGTALPDYDANGRTFTRLGNRAYGYPSAPHGLYPCAGDDEWIAIDCDTDWITPATQRSNLEESDAFRRVLAPLRPGDDAGAGPRIRPNRRGARL
jgi:crotonobetainyl-CoA:carnitine CoA-transferase CaiB-like acyl-CoA transferase